MYIYLICENLNIVNLHKQRCNHKTSVEVKQFIKYISE